MEKEKILFYSHPLLEDSLLSNLAKEKIRVEPFSSFHKNIFAPNSLLLFLLDKNAFFDVEKMSWIKHFYPYPCIIPSFDQEILPGWEESILFYLDKTLPATIFLQNIKRGFKILENQISLKEMEKNILLQQNTIEELQSIGISLSTEHDIHKLLRVIIRLAVDITNSDAGSLYLLEEDEEKKAKRLRFILNENRTLKIKSVPFTIPLNQQSISGYVALTKKIVNIEDSYRLDPQAPYSHSKKFDQEFNYRTKSMLTFPMINRKEEVIGVVQLVNKKKSSYKPLLKPEDFENEVISYTKWDEQMVYSLSSQAAVALENAILYEDIQKLFEGFVKASVKAIESRDPTTSGHSERVAFYSVQLAQAIEHSQATKKYAGISFSPDALKELKYAALLHDFGKVGVRENILTKSKKLYPGQLEVILTRIDVIQKEIKIDFLEKKLQNKSGIEEENQYNEINQKLENYKTLIVQFNEPTVLKEGDFSLLDEIESFDYQGKKILTPEESQKLRIPRGSLDEQERKEIENHVVHSYEFLKQIPWIKEMQNIPEIAAGHHEKLNGQGYPRHLSEKEILLGSKIMAIADIFDALTASDRPYKKALPVEKALEILKMEAKNQSIDEELLNIFIEQKIYALKFQGV